MNRGRRADEVIGRCRERLDRGEPLDAEAVLREHPDLAALLGPRLAVLALLASESGAGGRSLVGETLGSWHVVRTLGTGGMGTVYEAHGEGPGEGLAEDQRVALKVLHADLLARPGFSRRFLREAELGMRVRHDNVVRTRDAGEARVAGAPVWYLVMEYVEGQSLADLLDELGRVPEDLCRHIGREVAKGLAAIHAEGIVHRDLKPENVLITRDQLVKVMDLGMAWVHDDLPRLSRPGAFVGSIPYAAPEQLHRPHEVDGRADLHALGLLLYELCTGTHPFLGGDVRAVIRRVLEEMPPRAGEANPQVSAFFEELLAHLLAKEPERRVQTAAELLALLEAGEASTWWKERSLAIRRATRRPLRRIRIPRRTSLHGRAAELATLHALYERAKRGDGQVVLVEGEAGVGKTRLVDEFVLGLWRAGEDIDFLPGRHAPGGAATASSAFASAYHEHFGDDEAALREALPHTPLLVPAFAALLRGDAAPEAAEALTRDSLQTAFVHATRSLAARRTTVVLIDDLHFAPDEGRALFAALAHGVRGHRVLLLGSLRPGQDAWAGCLDGLPHVQRLALARLGARDLVELLADALRSRHLAEELAGKIALKSDGNPYFVLEILRGLREASLLVRRVDGTWVTTGEIRDVQVPSSIVDLVQARVSGLEPGDRGVLEAASCVGFEFDAAIVGAALGMARIPLLQRLGRIERTHRLVRVQGPRFVFDHHQVQEVLYAGLSPPLREAYHAAIAEALEAQAGDATPDRLGGPLCVELARHHLECAQGDRALRYLDMALGHLERNDLGDAAIGLAGRALQEAPLLQGRERCDVLLRRAMHLERAGRREEVWRSLEEVRTLADALGEPGLRARVRASMGAHLRLVSRYDAAIAVLGEAIRLSREAGDRREETRATLSLGGVCWALGRQDEARAHFERGLALGREIGDLHAQALSTGGLGSVLRSLGRHEEALTLVEYSLALHVQAGARAGEAIAAGNLGNVLRSLGRLEEARAYIEQSLARSRAIGDRHQEAVATGNLGNVLRALGRYAEAQAHVERSLALGRELADRRLEAAMTGNLGSLLRDLGRGADALDAATRCATLSREIGDRQTEAMAAANLGTLLQDAGRHEEALASFERCLSISRETGQRRIEAHGLLALGALLAEWGRQTEAAARLHEAAALASDVALPGVELVARAHLSALAGPTPALPDGIPEAAWEGTEVPEAMEARFLLWRATSDAAHLEEAKRLLDHVVAHAPPEFREPMVAGVRLHGEIAAAAHGRDRP